MNQKLIKYYIKEWESKGYSNGLPDEAPERLNALNKVPSFKAIALSILNNDHCLKGLGFSPKNTELYSTFKRIELGVNCQQLKLNLTYE